MEKLIRVCFPKVKRGIFTQKPKKYTRRPWKKNRLENRKIIRMRQIDTEESDDNNNKNLAWSANKVVIYVIRVGTRHRCLRLCVFDENTFFCWHCFFFVSSNESIS